MRVFLCLAFYLYSRMLKIRSGDKQVQALITELLSVLSDAGAVFHPTLQLEIRGAEISFSSRKKLKPGERLVKLPLSCMPLLADFTWSLDEAENLRWEVVESPLADAADFDLHRRLLGLLVQIYNRFGKVAAYARQSPAVQFVGSRPLVELLLQIAQERPFQAALEQGSEALKIHAFWHNRVFSDFATGRLHMIPLMEFFDHSLYAENFSWNSAAGADRALQHVYQPVDGAGKGIFARYEIMDSLHAFVKYGFVDEKAFFVQSQPFTLDLDESTRLEIGYQSASGNQCHVSEWQPAPRFSNSLMYRAALKFLPDRVFMPFMLIPPSRHLPAFDDALAAQLGEIERHGGREPGSLANTEVMQKVKASVLAENEQAYMALGKAAKEAELNAAAPATRLLKKMLRHQRQILGEFATSLG